MAVINIATSAVTTIPIPGPDVVLGAIAISPDGKFAYVTDGGGADNRVVPITIATNMVGTAIGGFVSPIDIAITLDSKFAYVVNSDGSVSVIRISDNTILTTFAVGTINLEHIAMTPDGTFAYVTDFGLLGTDGVVIPITLANNTPGTPIPLAFAFAIAMTHNFVPPVPPVPPIPAAPTNFVGTVCKNIFLNKTEYVLMATWKASSASDSALYRIYNGSNVIATIKPTDPLRFNTCVLGNFNASLISVAAVDVNGNESDHLVLQIQ